MLGTGPFQYAYRVYWSSAGGENMPYSGLFSSVDAPAFSVTAGRVGYYEATVFVYDVG